jgi:hypothetical protein
MVGNVIVAPDDNNKQYLIMDMKWGNTSIAAGGHTQPIHG